MVHQLVIVGGGNMGAALIQGLLRAGTLGPSDLAVTETLEGRRAELATMFPGVTIGSEVVEATGAVIAVKPGDVSAAVAATAHAGARRILSIAAGVTIGRLEEAAGADVAVVRAMPNTPALIGQGAAAIAGGRRATEDDLAWAEGILGAVGTVERVAESQLDAVTALEWLGPGVRVPRRRGIDRCRRGGRSRTPGGDAVDDAIARRFVRPTRRARRPGRLAGDGDVPGWDDGGGTCRPRGACATRCVRGCDSGRYCRAVSSSIHERRVNYDTVFRT